MMKEDYPHEFGQPLYREMERTYLRRYHLQALSMILMWIGGIEIAASFLVHYWFQFRIPYTPIFFMSLLVGIALYAVTRIF